MYPEQTGNDIRTVVIGFGGMGSKYVEILAGGQIRGMALQGVCCRNEAGQQKLRELYPQAAVYRSVEDTFAHANDFDAVVIVTPHDTHVEIGKKAFACGKHVICDKPAGVSTREVREFLAAKRKDTAFAMMFNTRTEPAFRKAKEMLDQGELGKVTRAIWTCNTWFRSPCYHQSAPWRSSWKGERGGLLINQCQHFLDIWQWLLGMPDAVDASIDFGKYNNFAVDDSVDLRFFYNNESGVNGMGQPRRFPGLRGSFLSASGEHPGVNRLEIWGTRGRLTVDGGKTLTFDRNDVDIRDFCRDNEEIYGVPSHHLEQIGVGTENRPYDTMFQNFSDHIHKGTPLLAPGEEGLSSIMLANGSYLSAWQHRRVDLPMDDGLYEVMLDQRISGEERLAERMK